MATYTWKIGERCAGGIITAETSKGKDNTTTVHIIQKQWDHSAGSTRKSNQSNATELDRVTFKTTDKGTHSKASNFLYNITDSYHAGKVIEWVESKVGKLSGNNW